LVAVGVDPGVDLGGVEAEEMTPLDVRDSLLVDETTDVTHVDAELLCDVADADKLTWHRWRGAAHVLLLLVFVCSSR
jgi:hypothetical protein